MNEELNPAAPDSSADSTKHPSPVVKRKKDGRRLGHQPKAEEMIKRLAVVTDWLMAGKTKHQIHREAEKLWGVYWQTADSYITRARVIMRAEIERPRVDLAAEQFKHYRRIAATDEKDRVAALRAIDDLLGLNAPKVIQFEVEVRHYVEVLIEWAVHYLPPEKQDEAIADLRARLLARRGGVVAGALDAAAPAAE